MRDVLSVDVLKEVDTDGKGGGILSVNGDIPHNLKSSALLTITSSPSST